jgi:hypothetical protein
LYLVLAHLIADFMLQPYVLVKMKRQPVGLAIHSTIHAAVTAVIAIPVLPRWWIIIPLLTVTHYVIDWSKVESGYVEGPASLVAFLTDQAVHLAVLALAVVLAGVPLGSEVTVGSLAVTGVLYYAVPYITVTFAGAILLYQIAVAFHTRRHPEELLTPGPRVLGMVVRAAALTVVLFLHPGLWWIGLVPLGIVSWGERHEAGWWVEAASGLGLAVALGVLFR